MTKYKLHNKGQGLIEVIVSITVIVVGILGAMTLATISIRSGAESREKVQASLLVQEGIEIVKNNRDTNWINNDNWDKDLLDTTNFKNGNVDPLNGQLSTPFTEFTRTVTISNIDDNKKQVNCRVSWSGGFVEAIDFITNWQEK